MSDSAPYELYAIRYATALRSRAEVFVGGDPHDAGPIPIDYFVWLARNGPHTVVIDTGFDALAAQRRGRQLLREPSAALALLGVDCAQVEHVIITHLHYDHAGNLPSFPRARFHLQEREMAFATGRYMAQAFFAHAYDIECVLSMVRLVYGAQVQFHDGDAEVVPGISVHHIGGHTLGLQVVRVRTHIGWVVLASDAAHYLANMTTGRPFPIVADVMQMTAGWQRMRKLASCPDYIVPGHDPLVMSRYREPTPALRGVAVRLDAEPEEASDGTTER
ncbi:MAG TPA: N-acyl homoserine lactonase family protein [Steroidobacteraceae bacterium]|nr:N-acyl homoserine lactonase family protein [Steroidobacteraceae bacterium]